MLADCIYKKFTYRLGYIFICYIISKLYYIFIYYIISKLYYIFMSTLYFILISILYYVICFLNKSVFTNKLNTV